MSVYDVFRALIHGFELSKSYPGSYCSALERLVTALFQFFVAVFSFVLIPLLRAIMKRNLKILELMETKPGRLG
jgi:hypothetical protein